MASDILDKLDEIDRSSGPHSDLVLEAGQLMESFAKGLDEIAILIERYGVSLTPSIANPLTFVLARKAERPTPRMAMLVLSFVDLFKCWDHPSTVMNSLTAVQHCLHYVDDSAGDALRHLSPFLRKCLDYDGRLWVIIKGHALALLPIMRDRDLTNKIFTNEEFLELCEKVQQLRMTAGEELRDELLDLENFI